MDAEEITPAEIVRLNKYIAHCGICTRKEAVDVIRKGFVAVNGEVELNPFRELLPEDTVTYKGKSVEPKKQFVYILLNKPHKVPFQSALDSEEMVTVRKLLLRLSQESLVPALPTMDTTAGLAVMTNDPGLVARLSDPEHRIKSVYQVQLNKPMEESDVEKLRLTMGKNSCLTGIDFPEPSDRTVLGAELICNTDQWLTSCFVELGYEVNRLDRTFVGGLTKKDLKRGWCRLLTEKEIVFLRYFH